MPALYITGSIVISARLKTVTPSTVLFLKIISNRRGCCISTGNDYGSIKTKSSIFLICC
ncbi:MAG: hypothetical protein JWQ40_2162 [Segetibacter sp.]|nr:hypothetical protein [Segetibacter sp.]